MAAEHGEGAVDLLRENGAGEFVGEGHGGERQELIGAGALAGREAVVTADEEDEVAAELFVGGKDLRELLRIEGFAGRIEENFAGGGMFGPEIEASGVDFAHFAGGEARGALDELGGEGVQHRVARLADKIDENFHFPNGSCSKL